MIVLSFTDVAIAPNVANGCRVNITDKPQCNVTAKEGINVYISTYILIVQYIVHDVDGIPYFCNLQSIGIIY